MQQHTMWVDKESIAVIMVKMPNEGNIVISGTYVYIRVDTYVQGHIIMVTYGYYGLIIANMSNRIYDGVSSKLLK